MTQHNKLSQQDQKLLDSVEDMLATPTDPITDPSSPVIVCQALRAARPQADETFRLALRRRLVDDDKEQQVVAHSTRVKHRLWSLTRLWGWQQPIAFVIALLCVLGVSLLLPETRMALAAWLGITFEQHTSLEALVLEVDHAALQESDDASYEVFRLTIPRDRWSMVTQNGFSLPQPGSELALTEEREFPIPSYLPQTYIWQDVALMNASMMHMGFPSLSGQSWAGGGKPLLPYNNSIGAFLIGGNQDNSMLLLSQFQIDVQQGLMFRPYFADVSEQDAQINRESMIEVGVFIEPATEEQPISFLVGTGGRYETTVNGMQAWWYHGTWDERGGWADTEQWVNLVWEQNDMVYHLASDALSLDNLRRIAESLPVS